MQRFASLKDLDEHRCTIEEMEEYEPHIVAGNVIYSGVDYEAIVRAAEQNDDPDVILFDGGNNDMPFYKADLQIVVVDPLRAGHEVAYYPGEANLRMADVVVINKMDSATPEQVKIVKDNIHRIVPTAEVVEADSELTLDGEIKGKRVLVIEDGPDAYPRRDEKSARRWSPPNGWAPAKSSSRANTPSVKSPKPI